MHSNLEKLNLIQNKVKDIIDKKQLKTKPKIINSQCQNIDL